EFTRCRQFYLAPDIDLTKIKTNSRVLKFIFEATRYIKFPLPELEYNSKNQWVFHPLYFWGSFSTILKLRVGNFSTSEFSSPVISTPFKITVSPFFKRSMALRARMGIIVL